MDIEATPPGSEFPERIKSALNECEVLVAIVGPDWLGARANAKPRIFDDEDWIRTEIETALARRIPIIPVRIDRAPMPKAEDLPISLRPFAAIEAADVDTGLNFKIDARRLTNTIMHYIGWKAALKRQRRTVAALLAILLIGVTYVALHLDNFAGSADKSQAAIQACNVAFALRCAQEGGAFGASDTLARVRSCKDHRLFLSDDASLSWKDIWTTSVFSFQPSGGGPGGGLDDDVLKVGGWGDWYFTLIKFTLPAQQRRPAFAAIALFSKDNEGASVPLAIDRIIHRWDFPKGGTLWWKDRPGHRAITTDPLPAPRREQWYLVEITDLVHEWLDQKTENNGVQIRPAHDFGSFVVFASSDAADKRKIPRLLLCT